MIKINEYIESGILETYVLGSASEAEVRELLYFKEKYPEVEQALFSLETDLERIALRMAVPPPPHVWYKIESEINELVTAPHADALTIKLPPGNSKGKEGKKNSQFLDVDASSSHMRIHKIWRLILIGLFVLGKIFLGFAIFFFLENRKLKEELQELKTELKVEKSVK